jgi:hypothetical protein
MNPLLLLDIILMGAAGALTGVVSGLVAYRATRRSLKARDRRQEAVQDPELAEARRRARAAAHRTFPELVG